MKQDLLEIAPAMTGTLLVTAFAFSGAVVMGFIVFALRRVRLWPVRAIAMAYGTVFRGLPPLTVVFIAFFGLGSVGLSLSPFVAGTAGLACIGSAYIAEYLRGAFSAIPAEQRHAGLAIGLLPHQALWYVTLPQAVRLAIPPTANYLLSLLKYTSVVSVIGVNELTFSANVRAQHNFSGPTTFLVAGALYLAMSYPLSVASRRLETRFGHGLT